MSAYNDVHGFRSTRQPVTRPMPKKRPKHLDLFRIRLPLPAFVSIAHRVSGAVLFLLIPLLLTLWQASLESADTFGEFRAVAAHWPVKLLLIGITWAYLHHFCAGIRHLALDLRYGTSLESARATSWAVLAASLTATVMFGALIW